MQCASPEILVPFTDFTAGHLKTLLLLANVGSSDVGAPSCFAVGGFDIHISLTPQFTFLSVC